MALCFLLKSLKVTYLLKSAMSDESPICLAFVLDLFYIKPPAKLGILETTGSQGLGLYEWQARHTGFSGSIVSKGWILRWASPSIVFCFFLLVVVVVIVDQTQ